MDPNVAYDQLSRYFAFPENGYVRNRRAAAEARGAAGKYGADERLRRGPRAVAGSPGCGREPASGQPLVEGQMVRTVRATTRMMAEALAAHMAEVGPCPCECNRGGFCGGCGHAGCGRR
jgi:hypothetical protein